MVCRIVQSLAPISMAEQHCSARVPGHF